MMSSTPVDRIARRFRDLDAGSEDPLTLLGRLVEEEAPLLDPAARERAISSLHSQLSGFGVLQEFCDEPGITDVLVNADGSVWVERAGRLTRTAVTVGADEATHIIERILGPIGLRADRSHPIVDGRLPDGSRVSVVLPPVALDGPLISIRRFSARTVSLESFAGGDIVAMLRSCVSGKANLVVYGGTGCGKTTLLNALCGELPPDERVITVEDTAELRLGLPHTVRLEARESNAEGVGAVPIRALIRAALRMRPDRVIVGEVRGPEALDMIWAMSTGHDGSLSTCHAATAADAMSRLETFALLADASLPLEAVRSQVRSAVDVLVGVGRTSEGRRRIHSIDVVDADREHGLRCVARDGSIIRNPEGRL